jgi:putative IMPACT (imprinted ancient) family translation regulator
VVDAIGGMIKAHVSSLLSASKELKVVLMECTVAEVNEVKSEFSEAWLNKTVKLK